MGRTRAWVDRVRQAGLALGLALAVLGAAGCDKDDDDEGEIGLTAFRDCQRLEEHIKKHAERQMDARLDQVLEGLNSRSSYDGLATQDVAPPAAAPTPAGGESAQDYTTTNTQEKDVDEPDFVKNDGSRLFLLHGKNLFAFSTWPPQETRLVAQAAIEGDPSDMFLAGDTVIVFSNVDLKPIFKEAGLDWPLPTFGDWGWGWGWAWRGGAEIACASFAPCFRRNGIKLTTFRASGAALTLVAEQWMEGVSVGARRTGDKARIVTSAYLHGPELEYWPEDVDWRSRSRTEKAFERLRERNRRVIRDSRLADWLPHFIERRPGQKAQEVDLPCGDCYASTARANLGLTSVSLVDVKQPEATAARSSLLALSDEVYASTDVLVLATRRPSWGWGSITPPEETVLHRWTTSEGVAGAARYDGSGVVPGYLADPFSIDEQDGYLRVATQKQNWSWDGQSSSAVYVLASSGGRLERVGEVKNIARGERLYAARFDGARGFLVTFRQIDPLFALDLSQPTDPRIAGELEVPGYSTYLHPLGADHLLTIGRDVTTDGVRTNGLKLAVFDVHDLQNPTLAHTLVVGSSSSSSEAEWDHHAFNFFPSRGLLAIPFSDYSRRNPEWSFESTLALFRVNTRDGISRVGAVDHADLFDRDNPGVPPSLRRGVMMDDYVYSISWGGLKVHAQSDLSKALVTLPLPPL